MHVLAVGQATVSSADPLVPPAGMASGMNCAPSQRTAIARPLLAVPADPTIVQAESELHDTPASVTHGVLPATVCDNTCQLLPFHRSARPRWVFAALPCPYAPTAMQLDSETQEIAPRLVPT